ncbi:molybdopterin molybdotransferase [Haloactinospora alba]|uniref:Molybdopterin molybdenumtransferase n=1 Tax=Haloactinospora alba TaxID=405555 RepID=A0A543NJY5_9ACTN|nr:molybdopterin molybdotransferase MoeA [Haloactinospora alba]TQN32175.1 molybdopterin molybdotransferase [Haloactinospora alba]
MGHAHGTPVLWEQARNEARELGRRCAGVSPSAVPLAEARGAVLAERVTADIGVPSYDSSAMDGYAVSGSGPWRVTARALAGAPLPVARLSSGEAVEIATGARVPEGTTAVLPYELAHHDGHGIVGDITPGRHVRRAGEDVPAGAAVLPEGTRVTPAVVGLAASLGRDTLLVRRPRVAVVTTGDEIVHSGIPGNGTVRDALGPMLPGIVTWSGAVVAGERHVADSFSAVSGMLAEAASDAGTDVVVVCGASSAGAADHLRGALRDVDATMLVDGVACRPGHPQILARMGTEQEPGAVVVGLPGNPNAALAGAVTLLVPLLAALAGRSDPSCAPPESLPLAGEVRPHHRDTRLVAVRERGSWVEPVGHDRPGSLRGAALADALAALPPDWAGSGVPLVWLPR